MPVTVPDHILALAHSPIDLSAPTKVRIAQAKAWLRVYPDETTASIARLYGLNPDSYTYSLQPEKLTLNTHHSLEVLIE